MRDTGLRKPNSISVKRKKSWARRVRPERSKKNARKEFQKQHRNLDYHPVYCSLVILYGEGLSQRRLVTRNTTNKLVSVNDFKVVISYPNMYHVKIQSVCKLLT